MMGPRLRESATVAVVALSGCSVLMRPPLSMERPVDHRVTCEERLGTPLLDSALVAGSLVVLSMVWSSLGRCAEQSRGDGTCVLELPLLIPPLLAAEAFGASAVYGFIRANACRNAKSPERIADRGRAYRAAQLTNAALVASRQGDCAAVKKLDVEVRNLHAGFFHGRMFRKEPDIRRCLARPAAPAPAVPHCFQDVADGETLSICVPSKADCDAAILMLPASDPARSCVARSAEDL